MSEEKLKQALRNWQNKIDDLEYELSMTSYWDFSKKDYIYMLIKEYKIKINEISKQIKLISIPDPEEIKEETKKAEYMIDKIEKMSDRQRLQDLEKNLQILYEKLGDFEQELIITAHAPTKFELRQRIKREISPSIRRYEAEYWELYPQEAILISEEEAATQLVRVEQAVEAIERIPQTEYPDKLMELLEDIRTKLDEGDKAASAKLKVALPLIPLIASYELEMDTEAMMYKTWKSLKKIVRR